MGQGLKFQTSKETLALEIFKHLNRAETQIDAVDEILQSIKKHLGVSAVGIRLEDDGDYPYHFYDGFSDVHIEMENFLCDGDTGHLACMCGRVLTGEADIKLPFFTDGGSFWSNNTDKLIENTSIEELGDTRNVCNAEGYLSVALIPLRNTSRIIGLLQLNDEKKGRFSDELIEFLEKLGDSIGIALARIDEEEHRRTLEKERKQLLHKYQLRIKELDCLYSISKLQENQDLNIEDILNLIVNLLPGSTQFPEVAVARLSLEDEAYTSEDYFEPVHKYSALIQNYGVIVGKLMIGYIDERPSDFNGPFMEEEIKLVNLVAETISRMIERRTSGAWRKSMDKYALILNDEEIRHITKLVLEDMAIGEMDREEYNINDLPDESKQTMESYMALQFNLELNRSLIIKLQNLLRIEE